jgi:hypothetical protein
MEELFPLCSGLALGALLGLLRPSLRLPTGVALAAALGVMATVASGEYSVSWAYLVIDIPLVVLAAAAGFVAARRLTLPAREA